MSANLSLSSIKSVLHVDIQARNWYGILDTRARLEFVQFVFNFIKKKKK